MVLLKNDGDVLPLKKSGQVVIEIRQGPNYPVVNGGSEKRSELGVPIFPTNVPYKQWGAVWSYLEFPNHLIAK